MNSKRNYKDSLFVHMFGRNVNAKEYFLSLYNALHGTNLKIDEVTIKPVTLSNTIYTGLENDVAMQIDDAVVVLIEQQSTINENLPFLKQCLPLESYTKFVQYVIFYKKSGEENYVAKAFKRCEEEGLLPDYFSELEKEEQTMIFGEYSYEDDIRVQRQEAFEDGMEKGIAQGMAQGVAQQKAEDEKVISEQAAEIELQAQRIAEL